MSATTGHAPRIGPLDRDQATGRARELLDEIASRGGEPGPMVRAMANAPALLRGYLDLNRAMKRSHLDRRISERISLAVQEWLGCDCCIAAHTRAARELGLDETDIALARQGTATDPLTHNREECRVNMTYLIWAAAVGAAGCGRCATAV